MKGLKFTILALVIVASLLPGAVFATTGTLRDTTFSGAVLLDLEQVPIGTVVRLSYASGNIDGMVLPVGGSRAYTIVVPKGTPEDSPVQFTVLINGLRLPANVSSQDTVKSGAKIWRPIFVTMPLSKPRIVTQSIPLSTGAGYSTQISATGGDPPYRFFSQNLPKGFTLTPQGLLSGIPPMRGHFLFSVGVEDSFGAIAGQNYDLSVLWPFGDANGDGIVDVADIITVERIILGLLPQTAGADATHEGVVNIGDVAKIDRMILGLE